MPKARFITTLSIAALFAVIFLLLRSAPTMSSSAPVPDHVLTWVYDGANGSMTDGTTPHSTNSTSKRHVQTWVSFAEAGSESGRPHEKGFYDCGYSGAPCKFVIYSDPVTLSADCRPDSDYLSENTSEDFYMHDDAPNASDRTTRMHNGCGGGPTTQYFPNLLNPAVGQWFARKQLWNLPKNNNTVIFMDRGDADCRNAAFHPGERFTPYELRNAPSCEAALANGLRTAAMQMRWQDGTAVPVIVNGLAPTSQKEVAHVATIPVLSPGSNIIGGVAEGPEISGTKYIPRNTFGDVNTASLVYATNPDALYVLLGYPRAAMGSTQPCNDTDRNYEENCGQLTQRRNLLATFWLAYKEQHTVLWELTSSHEAGNPGKYLLSVMPEASIYPTQPIQALKPFDARVPTTDGSGCGPRPGSGGVQSFVVSCGSLNDGRTPAGVYVREFRRCYNFGQLIGSGQCAVVKNTTDTAITVGNWFSQSYSHSMTLGTGPRDGGDVLSAGCGDSRCPTTAINPLGAAFSAGRTQVPAFDALFLFHD